MKERWKAILVNDEPYGISDQGRVQRMSTNRILKPTLRDYSLVNIGPHGRKVSRLVHLLVMEAFVGVKPAGRVTAHLNGNPHDNRLANLAYVTPEENERHKKSHGTAPVGEKCVHAKLTDRQAHLVRKIVNEGATQATVAELLGMSANAISEIVRGKTYQHDGAVGAADGANKGNDDE